MAARSRALAAALRAAAALLLAVALRGAPALAAVSASADVDAASEDVEVVVESPTPGAHVENKVHMAPVRGRASAGDDAWRAFDVVLAIDVSYSTREPSGIDVDEDGEIGFNPELELVAPGAYPEGTICTDPDDTILAAEVHAARLLLDELDPTRTRVGIVAFSGASDPATGRRISSDQRDAWVVVPLTTDFARLRGALDGILAEGPQHATNFAAAVRLAVTELAGLSGAQSAAREDARRVVLFLTDGQPSFPYGSAAVADPEHIEAAISAARLAHKAGITINTYALGKQALARPVAATEIARITLGNFLPVRNPGNIVSFLQGVSFANVDDVVLTNLTTKEVSYDVSLLPDGSFSGFVPVRPGANTIEVTALASDGAEASATVAFEFAEAGLTERELERELERIKKRNKALLRLLERERIERFRRRRREVVIEADPNEAAAGAREPGAGADNRPAGAGD